MANKQFYVWIVVGLLCAGLHQPQAVAGDLDQAYDYYQVVHHLLGRDSVIAVTDTATTGVLTMAVNAGVRQVAINIGITTRQTITIVDTTYFYTLDAGFIANEMPHMPLKVWIISSDNTEIYGLTRGLPSSFGEPVTAFASKFNLSGDRLWIYPAAPAGASVHVEGPSDATTMLHGAATTNVDEADRMAVCYWAAYIIGVGISHPQTQSFLNAYSDHVKQRGGTITEVLGQ